MEIKFGHVFNLFDTNGRRKDIINALDIYLNILKKEQENDPDYIWGKFPKTNAQFIFYEKAIELSPDVFKKHAIYDKFIGKYKHEVEQFRNGSSTQLQNSLSKSDWRKQLDEGIEKRARHYTSNLCKLGFSTEKRVITDVGLSFINDSIEKDKIESLFPLSNTNIIILRQMLKLKIYQKKQEDESRQTYSPFFMALYLLLNNDRVSTEDFKRVVQFCSPYAPKIASTIYSDYLSGKDDAYPIDKTIPEDLKIKTKLSKPIFDKYFKNRKSSKPVSSYYKLYCSLWDYKTNANDETLNELRTIFTNKNTKSALEKAFGFGKGLFDFGDSSYLDVLFFNSLNEKNGLLSCELDDFNSTFYTRFIYSKYYDTANEYGDTTCRIFKATGLFEFKKGIAKLAHQHVLRLIFPNDFLEKNIFGKVAGDEFKKNESLFLQNINLTAVLGLDEVEVDSILNKLETKLGKKITEIPSFLKDETSLAFKEYIDKKYPKQKVLKLLRMFEDRTNDNKIKKEVNPDADVPTIYEYVTAIAWYYISNKTIDVYDSLNLTMNANFEPIRHASGNKGDIVIEENSRVTMLEVTLLTGSAQDTNEYQPVLKHSCDLKVEYAGKDTITFFISCSLYTPTVFNWRNDYTTSKMAPATYTVVNNVVIMSFTSEEICMFIENNVTSDLIVQRTREAFANNVFENNWRNDIINSLLS